MKKTVLSVAVWLAALCVCLLLADRMTRRDDGARKYDAFFAEQQDIDVFFLGTSRVLDGVSPMELWRDFGITSYNLANSSEVLDVTEQVLRLALESHTPKVAVIDVYYVHHSVDERWTYPYRHLFFDEIPLSRAKLEAVHATLPQSEWLEFLMPFSLYHGRWEELLSGSVERMVDCETFMMGSELRIGRTPCEGFVRTQATTEETLPGFAALERIVALCRERGVEPVFLMVPAPLDELEQTWVNSVAPLAERLGVPFVNLLDEDTGVDFGTDCYDVVGHLNPDGASKTTAWLGHWLTAHFPLADHRSDTAYGHWHARLLQYEAFRAAQWEQLH